MGQAQIARRLEEEVWMYNQAPFFGGKTRTHLRASYIEFLSCHHTPYSPHCPPGADSTAEREGFRPHHRRHGAE
jgi:hypothetical protein